MVTEPASAAVPTSSPGVPTSSVGRPPAGPGTRCTDVPNRSPFSAVPGTPELACDSIRAAGRRDRLSRLSTRTAPARRVPARREARHAHRHHAPADRERRPEGGPRRGFIGERLPEPGDLGVVGAGVLVGVDPERGDLAGVGGTR